MVTGMDLLVDRLFAFLYKAAGQGGVRAWSRKGLAEEIDCAYSPTFRQAIEWAKQSGVITEFRAYDRGRYKVFYQLSDEAIGAALADEWSKQDVTASPF